MLKLFYKNSKFLYIINIHYLFPFSKPNFRIEESILLKYLIGKILCLICFAFYPTYRVVFITK